MTTSNLSPRKKSSLATAALIFGILSFLCLGPLAGIPAIILGILAVSRANSRPTEYTGHGTGLAGIITGAVGSFVGTGIAALFLAILLPSFGRARELSNRTVDAASLRQIGQALQIYANENLGRLPPQLAATTTVIESPQWFVSRNTTTTPPTYAIPVTDWTTLIPEINDHTDWIYASPGTRWISDPAIILAYSKDIYHHDGRNVLFADGHVEFVRAADLPTLFSANNAVREREGLAAISLDGPVSAPQTLAPRAPGQPLPPENFPRPPRIARVPSSAPRGFSHAMPTTPAAALAALRSTDPTERRSALIYLHRKSTSDPALRKDIAAALVQALQTPEDQRPALEALQNWGSKDDAPAVIACLKSAAQDPHANSTRSAALRTLGYLGGPDAISAAVDSLSTPQLRFPATDALRRIGPDAEDAVRTALNNGDAATQRAACTILRDIGNSASLEDLHKIAAGPDHLAARDAQLAIDAITARNKALSLDPTPTTAPATSPNQ